MKVIRWPILTLLMLLFVAGGSVWAAGTSQSASISIEVAEPETMQSMGYHDCCDEQEMHNCCQTVDGCSLDCALSHCATHSPIWLGNEWILPKKVTSGFSSRLITHYLSRVITPLTPPPLV